MTHAVAFGVTVPSYNREPPFHPDARFPELPFDEVSGSPNWPYRLLRELLAALELDGARFGTPEWNPLGDLIRPGQTVVLKPNFVLSFNAGGDDLFAMVTHPSLLRAMVDYAFLALRGEGRIVIADTPQMDCDWDELMQAERLDAIQYFYASRFGFRIEVQDLRDFAVIDRRRPPLTANRRTLPGDPAGSVVINLGRRSHFHGLPNQAFYGADYDRQETIAHHQGETHEYRVSKTILAADVFLSLPKMKTHKKVGVTLNLKGLVGINTNKNYLVHYRLGSPRTGGDQLPDSRPRSDRMKVRLQRWASDRLLARRSPGADLLYRLGQGVYRATVKPFHSVSQETQVLDAGNWHGNDSAWRMTADLTKILFFADASGTLHDTPQRKMFCVVDGIVGGEGMGPLEPKARPSGCLVAGLHPIAVDLLATRLMGFDPRKLRQFDVAFDGAWDFGLKSFADIEVRAPGRSLPFPELLADGRHDPLFRFEPHPGWKRQIEIGVPTAQASPPA